MSTLAEIRACIRNDLHDTDAGAYRWSDAELDRHIGRALDDLSRAIPRELAATVATTAGSRELSLAALTGLIEVEAVEFPTGAFPPCSVGFSGWAGSLTLHTETPPDGSDAKVYYLAQHTLDGSGTTLPAHLQDLVAAGAAAYAALEWAAFAIDRLNTGDGVAQQFEAWGRARATAFQQLLKHHGRGSRAKARRLYTPV